jgi:hypothetical protein
LLFFVGVVIGLVIYVITKDIVSIVAICILLIVFGYFGTKKPRQLKYSVSHKGLTVGDKHYSYELFKNYAINEQSSIGQIQLMPLKRFMVPLTIYYEPEDEIKIVNILGNYLPIDTYKVDMIENFMKRLHF